MAELPNLTRVPNGQGCRRCASQTFVEDAEGLRCAACGTPAEDTLMPKPGLAVMIELTNAIGDREVAADLMLASTWHSLLGRLNDNIDLLRIMAGPEALNIKYADRWQILSNYRAGRDTKEPP